jgi:anionic cell wall polymer biosynthesis LytR-Cps2A-Psr (LCP) family protein
VQGLQALQFLRTRHGVGDGSDLGRIGNQQQYMSSLARKLISGEVLGNVPVMLRLAHTALSNLEPSTSLTNPTTLVQIGLAVKDVPFEDIVFLQYPTFEDPDNVNTVVPDYTSAQTMWDAINANKQLQVTHQNTSNDGVVIEDQPSAEEAGETATPTPTDTAAPSTDVEALPDNIKGNSAAQQTCSNGNVRQ